MKKILSIALVLILSLSLLAGCGGKKGEEAPSDLVNAKSFLEDMIYGTQFKPGDTMPIDRDKDVVNVVTVDGVSYPVEWSITITEGAADSVKISESDTANHVMIDLPDVAETDILFSAVANIKDESGKTETATFNYKMACTLGELEILDKAYALDDGAKLSGTPSLTGDIIEIKTPYDATTKSISVVIQIGDAADKPVLCSGLMGDYVDGLVVGDNICVAGVLGKNGGVVSFESGCTMVYVNKADGSTPGADDTDDTTTVPGDDVTTIPGDDTTAVDNGSTTIAGNDSTTKNPGATTTKKPGTTAAPTQLKKVTDQAKILKDITKLGENEFLSYIAVLTGKVLQVEQYNDQYKSVTLTFKVGDTTLECYQMKGNGVDKVKSNDTITVQGVIKNYAYQNASGETKTKLEFAWHEASGTEVTLTKLVASAAQDLSTPAKILAAAKALQNGESLQKEVTLTGKVLDVETPYDPNYENITVNIRVDNVDIKCYRLKGNGVKDIKANDTITVKGIIKNFNGIIEFDTGCTMTKRVAGSGGAAAALSVVSSPKAGVAYKFGMVQENVDKKSVYYLKGGMSGFYMATSSNSTAAIDVYLENANGGFHLYAMVNGQKQYINMVVSADGKHVNGAYESTAKTVYTYDSAAQTLVTEVDGALYWFGTRNDKNYTTVGPCKTEYEGFYCKFYA